MAKFKYCHLLMNLQKGAWSRNLKNKDIHKKQLTFLNIYQSENLTKMLTNVNN